MHRPIVLMMLAAVMMLPASPVQADEQTDDRAQRRSPVVEVFQQSRDAVVNISSTEVVHVRSRSPFDFFFDDFFDMPRRSPGMRQYTRTSIGSGFIIHGDGYIVTNAHVVARSAEQKVIFADGREYDAHIVAADQSRDLAVLKIEADTSLPTLTLGRSDDLMIGETVIAIGNPLGYQHTVTAGVVSAVDREMAISEELSFKGLIQTDASINPGNSGGPLLNVLGQLIGINTAIRGDAQNIGFAIPVDHLREVLPDLLDVERRYRIDSGLVVDNLGQPRVTEVRPDSPAAKAGIRPGDVLTAINGTPVRKGIDFDIALINRHPGETLNLTLQRDAGQQLASLTLAARPAPDGEELAWARLGFEVLPLSQAVADRFDLTGAAGLVVGRIERGGPADEAGVEPADILLALGRRYVGSIDELGQLLESLDRGDVVQVRILRQERRGKIQRYGPIKVR